MRIASVGECMVELAPDGQGGWQLGFAGDAFNTIWTLRGLLPADATCDFVSAYGDDAFSRQQLDFFHQHGIGVSESPRLPGARPGLYAITLDGYERSFTYWRSDSAARRLADDSDLLAASLAGRDLIYVTGITLAILTPAARATLFNALRKARSTGSRIAFDPNYRPRLWPEASIAATALNDILAVVDISLPTFDDERMLHGDAGPGATLARLQAAGIAEIVVKDGADPAWVGGPDGVKKVPASRVAQPVDTSGAGDAFNGGYLAARLAGLPPVEAARAAHAAAAAAIQVRGALTPFDILRVAVAITESGPAATAD